MKKLLCIVPLLVTLLSNTAFADADAETAAVKDVMDAYVAAFDAADPQLLASLWAEDGEYLDEQTDDTAKGRDAIEQVFLAYFERSQDASIKLVVQSRVFSANVAIEEGMATIVVPESDPRVSHYTATYVKQNGDWLLDQMVIQEAAGLSTAAVFQMIAEIIGGLGIFLLGMKNMSDGMQAVAGASLRRLVSAVTNNRFMAAGVGTLTTCLVQSSSVTTVMVIGFVNSGVMQLSQGVGVIMGANIGTTITGWLLVLEVGKYGLPILGAAAFVYLFSKGDRWRYWAMAIMGVGMVFFGLELMKDACDLIKDMPAFLAWFHYFDAGNYIGVLMCALAGCVLTMLVQSSSATLGITIAFAVQGVIPFETAAALVLGENIGTTVTAYLASLGATTGARRAAYFHVIFNLVGVFWVTLIFHHGYMDLIRWVVTVDINEAVVTAGVTSYPYMKVGIATTHTVFNVVNTLLFLPFVPLMVKLLERIVPAKTYKEKPRLTDLDVRMLETPLVAIEQSRMEIIKMGDGCRKMLDWQKTLIVEDEPDRDLVDRLNRRERVLDDVHDEVTEYVTGLLSGNVPHTVAEEARRQMRMADEYESVSDYVADLLKFDTKLRTDGYRFTEKQRGELVELNDLVAAYMTAVNEGNTQQNLNTHGETEAARKHIGGEIKRLRHGLLDDLSGQAIPPRVSVAYMAALNAFARVRDHTHNIAEAVSGEK